MGERTLIFLGNNEATLRCLVSGGFKIRAAVREARDDIAHSGACDAALSEQGALNVAIAKDSPDALENALRGLDPPDLIVVSSFTLLRRSLLEWPRFGCLNIHPSYLPNYKGAHPIQWALINGETETGVTFMRASPRMDCGGIYERKRIGIGVDDDYFAIATRIDAVVEETLPALLRDVFDGQKQPSPQEGQGSYFPKLTPAVRFVHFRKMTARDIHNVTRSQSAFGGSLTTLDLKKVPLAKTKLLATESKDEPGTILSVDVDYVDGLDEPDDTSHARWITLACRGGLLKALVGNGYRGALPVGALLGT